jgi:hypothetical protein
VLFSTMPPVTRIAIVYQTVATVSTVALAYVNNLWISRRSCQLDYHNFDKEREGAEAPSR